MLRHHPQGLHIISYPSDKIPASDLGLQKANHFGSSVICGFVQTLPQLRPPTHTNISISITDTPIAVANDVAVANLVVVVVVVVARADLAPVLTLLAFSNSLPSRERDQLSRLHDGGIDHRPHPLKARWRFQDRRGKGVEILESAAIDAFVKRVVVFVEQVVGMITNWLVNAVLEGMQLMGERIEMHVFVFEDVVAVGGVEF